MAGKYFAGVLDRLMVNKDEQENKEKKNGKEKKAAKEVLKTEENWLYRACRLMTAGLFYLLMHIVPYIAAFNFADRNLGSNVFSSFA